MSMLADSLGPNTSILMIKRPIGDRLRLRLSSAERGWPMKPFDSKSEKEKHVE